MFFSVFVGRLNGAELNYSRKALQVEDKTVQTDDFLLTPVPVSSQIEVANVAHVQESACTQTETTYPDYVPEIMDDIIPRSVEECEKIYQDLVSKCVIIQQLFQVKFLKEN